MAGCVNPHVVFTGTKYSVRQQRGRFGIGAKMVRCRADYTVLQQLLTLFCTARSFATAQALICAKVTADEPLEVRSAQPGSSFITHCRLDIDVVKNLPNILKLDKMPQSSAPWQGTEVSVLIEGEWNTGRGVRRLDAGFPVWSPSLTYPGSDPCRRGVAGKRRPLHSAPGIDHAVRTL